MNDAVRRRRRIAAMSLEQLTNMRAKDCARVKKWRLKNPIAAKRILDKSRQKRKLEGKIISDPIYQRRWHLKNTYNLSEEEWQQIFSLQKHACAICRSTLPGNKRGWVVDHDHSTGEIRGILCHHCNIMIHNKMSSEIFQAAIRYLERKL